MAHSLDESQLDKGIYTIEYDPDNIPININLLVGIGACCIFIIACYCFCCGKKKENDC